MAPSSGFRVRLDAGLAGSAVGSEPSASAWGGILATLLILSAVGVVASHLRTTDGRSLAVEPAGVTPKPVANRGLPFVTFYDPRLTVQVSAPTPYVGRVSGRPAARPTVFR